MKIRIDQTSNLSSQKANLTSVKDIPSGESFQNVLVLNQTALKAMTIDSMIEKSATGTVNPDAVDAAAIMAFRSTLPSNIVSPVPTEKGDLGSPYKPPVKEDDSPIILPGDSSDVDISDVYNSGVLKCSDELNTYFKEASEKYGVDVKLLKAIACAESNFDPTATSKSGAMGIMQMMPGTAKECGVSDPYDPRQSIMGGAYYISQMLDRYDGNISYALAAYNAGANNVDKYGGIPPFEQTQNYVVTVSKYYHL